MVVGGGIDIATIMKGLSIDGLEADILKDPDKALMNYERESYDLVIADVRMAKMNGFELCKEIRKRDSKVKICLMTAFEIHMGEFEKVLPSIKVDGFITKPVHISTLYAELRRLLTVSEAG